MSKLTIVVAVAALFGGTAASAYASVERPPQFVLMAFDNCTELDRWENLTKFVNDMNAQKIPVQFTFFVSGVNFLAEKNKDLYQGPHHAAGESDIDFGGSPDDVRRRVGFVNGLHAAGNEIGSHAVGHFHGGEGKWSADDWRNEFVSYKSLFLNVGQNNGLPSDVKFDFPFEEAVGFRAPYLDTTPGLYVVLRENKFRYDTSSDHDSTDWPKKQNGIWRFNLADLKIAGTGKPTLSMDYNFYVGQSGAKEDPDHYEDYRQQMFDTYIAYFKANYTGNRAPINIGHHFAPYQGGMYHQALQAFAKSVCALPEVRCVTYRQLADFMDGLSESTLAAYQKGDFPHAGEPTIAVAAAFTDAPPAAAVKRGARTLNASLVGANKATYPKGDFAWFVDGREVGKGPSLPTARLPRGHTASLTVVYRAAEGQEEVRATQNVRRTGRSARLIPLHAELDLRSLKK
jgi:hypothetical protein